jgi:hypothetical protein
MITMESIAAGWTIVALCFATLMTLFVLWDVERNAKKPDKRFSITPQFIEVARWDRRVFQIEWSGLTAINIVKEDKSDDETALTYYTITFTTQSSSRTIKFDAITDFSPEKIDVFIYFLVQIARQRDVRVMGIEKWIKRIPFVYPKCERDLVDWKIFKDKHLQQMWDEFTKEKDFNHYVLG